RPFIPSMLAWLARHGVDDVVMSCGFLATAVRNVLGDGSQYGLRLRFIEEPEPRGTAGGAHAPAPAPPARGPRPRRHARARARGRPHGLWPRAPARRPRGQGVRREAERRPD